jgi:DNA-binding MarR family transcriptional regulator
MTRSRTVPTPAARGHAPTLDAVVRAQADSAGFLLIRCAQLWNDRAIARVNAEAQRPVLREAHTRLLPHLMAPEGVRIVDLARTLGVTKQAVAPLVQELADEGVVEVAPDPQDGRAKRATLTAHGRAAMLHGTGVLLDIERELAAQLGAAHMRALKDALTALHGVLVGADPATPREAPTRTRSRAAPTDAARSATAPRGRARRRAR